MGGIHQRAAQVWLTIERNEKISQNDLFDFTKQRFTVNSSKVCFPSYLHYYEQSKLVTYSLLQDHQNAIVALDYNETSECDLFFTKIKKTFKDKIWNLLREQEQVELKKGDFIKLGRIELEIKELRFLNSKQSVKKLSIECDAQNSKSAANFQVFASSNYLKSSDLISRYALSRMKDSDMSLTPSAYNMKQSIYTQKSSNEVLCRFCFDGASSISNPLFNVCLCAGSVKNIHYQCLRNWVRNKMGRVQTSHCIYYHYQPLVCELCKHQISNEILFDGRTYPLIEPERMHPPYVRLQHKEDNKVFEILIRLEELAKIDIGRGSQNELNLNDPSISRSHCSLFYTSHRLFIKGKKSKYGTFVELSKTMNLQSNKPIEISIQNNLITIDRKLQQKGFFDQQCCGIENSYRLIVK